MRKEAELYLSFEFKFQEKQEPDTRQPVQNQVPQSIAGSPINRFRIRRKRPGQQQRRRRNRRPRRRQHWHWRSVQQQQ